MIEQAIELLMKIKMAHIEEIAELAVAELAVAEKESSNLVITVRILEVKIEIENIDAVLRQFHRRLE